MRQSHRLQAAPLTAGLSKEGLLSKILSNSNAQSLGEKNQKITPLPHKNTTKSVYDLNSTPGSTLAAMGRGSGGRFYYYYYPTFRGRTGRYRGNEWPPRSQEGERPARFELPPPLPHTHPCTLHQGPPIFLIRTRYCQAPAPAQPRSQHSTARTEKGDRAGLEDAGVASRREPVDLGRHIADRRETGSSSPGRTPPSASHAGDYLGTLNPVPKPRWGRLTRLFSNPGLAKEPST